MDEVTAMFDVDDSQDNGEILYNAVGWIDGKLYTLTFTPRRDVLRAISLRRANRNERRVMRSSFKERELVPDAENPEWTPEKFARAERFHELPLELQAVLSPKRGPQKAPTKKLISIRLSADVLAALRAKGQGWQALVDDTLREQFVNAK